MYKLEEIDQRFRIFRRGDRVLDLGCKPGSWLQYAAQRSGDGAKLVGIDRTSLDPKHVPAGGRVLVGDVFSVELAQLAGALDAFDVVMSDMAPDTTGVRSLDQARSEALFERALEIAEQLLSPGGRFVGKLFQGPGWNDLLRRVRTRFAKVRTVKPEGSRKESIEQYVVGIGFR